MNPIFDPTVAQATIELAFVRAEIHRATTASQPLARPGLVDDLLRGAIGRLNGYGKPTCPKWSTGGIACQWPQGHTVPHSFEFHHDGIPVDEALEVLR